MAISGVATTWYVQIRFSSEDLTRITFAAPGPVLESLLAVRQLRPAAPGDRFTEWRRQVTPAIAGVCAVHHLAELLPRRGRPLDLLMPTCGAPTRDAGIAQLESLKPDYLQRELVHVSKARRIPRWTASLAERDPRGRRELFKAVELVHDHCLERRIEGDAAIVRQEIGVRSRMVVDGGLHYALGNLHPLISWDLPVLTVAGEDPLVVDKFDLGGRGLTLVPSVFADHPQYFLDPNGDRPSILIYPVSQVAARQAPLPRLEPLLGRTRAAVLAALLPSSASTTELARRASISVASASEHARVLRDAGLLSTDRGRHATHRLTPSGMALSSGFLQQATRGDVALRLRQAQSPRQGSQGGTQHSR